MVQWFPITIGTLSFHCKVIMDVLLKAIVEHVGLWFFKKLGETRSVNEDEVSMKGKQREEDRSLPTLGGN